MDSCATSKVRSGEGVQWERESEMVSAWGIRNAGFYRKGDLQMLRIIAVMLLSRSDKLTAVLDLSYLHQSLLVGFVQIEDLQQIACFAHLLEEKYFNLALYLRVVARGFVFLLCRSGSSICY